MIIAIVGPTGVGKTKMSISLAKRYNAEIISCDSMQIYKKMDIGTAKGNFSWKRRYTTSHDWYKGCKWRLFGIWLSKRC